MVTVHGATARIIREAADSIGLNDPHYADALNALAVIAEAHADDESDDDGIDRAAEDDYRAHSSSVTGVYEAHE